MADFKLTPVEADSGASFKLTPVDEGRSWSDAASDTVSNLAEGASTGIMQMAGGAAERLYQETAKTPAEFVKDAARRGVSAVLSVAPTAKAVFDAATAPTEKTEFTPQDVEKIRADQVAHDTSTLGTLSNIFRDETKFYQDHYKAGRSAAGNAMDQGLGEASKDGAISALDYLRKNPGALLNMSAKSLGYSAPIMMASRVGGESTGVATNMGMTGLAGGASSADQTRESLMSMPEEAWKASPQYVSLRKAGMDHGEAAGYLSEKAAAKAFDQAALVSAAAGAITAPLEVKMMRGGPVVTGTGLAAEAKALGKTVAKEGTEEYLQEGWGEQLAQHMGEASVGVPKNVGDVLQDVNTQGVLGAVGGIGQGGGMHIASRAGAAVDSRRKPGVQPADTPAAADTPATPAQAAPSAFNEQQASAIVGFAEDRQAALEAKANGTEDTAVQGPDGKQIIIPGKKAEYLSDAEKSERDFLRINSSKPDVLAKAYGLNNGETENGQIPAATNAEVAAPGNEGAGNELPGSGNVLGAVPNGNADNSNLSAGVAEAGMRPAESTGNASAPSLTYPAQQTNTRVLDQKPVELAMPKLSPEHVEKVTAIDSRIEEIAAEIPTRTKPVQASLQREADKLAKEKAQIVNQAHADEGADPELMAQYNAAKQAGNNAEMYRLAHEINTLKRKKKEPAKAEAPKGEQGLSLGTMPNNAEPITVRNGVVYVGSYPAQDYDSGDDVTVPNGATPQQIRNALTKAGAIARGQKVFGLQAEEKAPKQPKAARDKIDPAKDSLFVAIAKLGGMDTQELLSNGFDRNDITQETAGRVSKKGKNAGKLGKKSRKPIAMGFALPLHKNGGLSFDGVLEALKQHGYFAEDATKNDAIDAFRAELGGDKHLTPDALMQQAEQDQAERDAMMAAEQDRIDAENAAEEAAKEESGYDDLSEEAQDIADDFGDIDNPANAKTGEDAMRTFGFTEDEINEQVRQGGESGTEGVAGKGSDAAGSRAETDRAGGGQDGQSQEKVPEGAKPGAGNEEGGKGRRTEVGGFEQGRVGMKLAAGQIVLTASGRETTPFPKFQSSTGKMNKSHLAAVDAWLLKNAEQEAVLRGDTFNSRQFERDHYDAVNRKTVPQASKDAAEEYLFGQQPADVPSILKSLVPDQNGGFTLAGQTPAEVKAQEAKRKADEEAAAKAAREPAGPTVKVDQVDTIQTKETDKGTAMFSRFGQEYNERPRFYSQLERAIEVAPDKVFGPAKQVKAWLQSNSAKLGVKADEIQWTGITDWLDMQAGKVSKSDVLNYLQQNGVKVEEVVKGGVDEGEIEAFLNDEAGIGFTREEAIEYLKQNQENDSLTKYEKYQLPGGENYRELLLTLPEKHTFPKEQPLSMAEQERAATLTQKMRRDGNLPEAEMEEWRELNAKSRAHVDALEALRKAGKNQDPFRSNHWDEPNILAHVRFNDRTDADGAKVLFVEELQSDAGQGKRDGKVDWNAPFIGKTEAWLSLGIKRMIAYAVENNYEKVAFIDGQQSTDRYWKHELIAPAVDRWNEITKPDSVRKLGEDVLGGKMYSLVSLDHVDAGVLPMLKNDKVVDAVVSGIPVDVVNMLSNNGFVAKQLFGNGDMVFNGLSVPDRSRAASAIRASVSKTAATIRTKLGGIGSGRSDIEVLPALQASDLDPRDIVGIVSPSTIFDGVSSGLPKEGASASSVTEPSALQKGKGLEKQLGSAELAKLLNAHAELRYGREGLLQHSVEPPPSQGMKAFYDQIVPQVANDVLKKLGGGKVETVEVAKNGIVGKSVRAEDRPRMVKERSLFDQSGFTITPAMREKVSGGIPLFARGNYGAIDIQDLDAVAASFSREFPGIPVVTLESEKQAPKSLQAEIKKAGVSGDFAGVYHNKKIYLLQSGIRDIEHAQHVVIHEGVHGGLNRLGVSDDALLSIGASNPKLHSEARKLKTKYGYSFARSIEEAMADMGPAARQLSGWGKLVGAVRAKLRKMKLVREWSDNDVSYLILRALNALKTGEKTNFFSDKTMYSGIQQLRRKIGKDDSKISALLTMLAEHDDLFQQPAAFSDTPEEIGKEIDPSYPVKKLGPSSAKAEGVDNIWEIGVPKSPARKAYMLQKGDEVWVDLQHLLPGVDAGNIIYGIAAGFSHNTNRVLIGDPAGLARMAFYRRTENMISSILKYGTSDHLAPHIAQVNPAGYYYDMGHAEFGQSVRAVDWEEGNTARNLRELIYTAYQGAVSNAPEIKDVFYDFDRRAFVQARPGAAPVSFADEEFDKLSLRVSGREGSLYRAGSATLKRAALVNTLVRGTSQEEWRRIVAQVGRQLSGTDSTGTGPAAGLDPALRKTFYSRSGQTPAPLRQPSVTQRIKQKIDYLTSAETLDSAIYQTQNKMIDLKRLQDRITKLGAVVDESADAYLGEEMFHGRLAKRTQDFQKNELKPLLKAMNDAGVSQDELEQFLHARHAKERNAEMASRNPNQAKIDAEQARIKAELKDIETKLGAANTSGAATVALEQARAKAAADWQVWGRAEAFQGTEAERMSLSGMTDADADAYLSVLSGEQRTKLEALAAKVDAMNEQTLKVLEDYGLESRATLNSWRKQYQHYVPLHRDNAHPDGVGHPVGSGFSVKGSASKKATGSNEEVTHILTHIAMQREAALTRGEKNRVAQRLYLLAKQNPDPNFWTTAMPTSRVLNKHGIVESTIDPLHRTRENVVMLRAGGKDLSITFSEHNPQAVRLAQALKNLDGTDLDVVESLVAKGTRWFASVNTQYNPIFGIINLLRDSQTGVLNLTTTEIADKKIEVAAGIIPALRTVYGMERNDRDFLKIRGYQPGSAYKPSAQWAAIFEEFQEAGGTTGYRDLFANAEDRAKALTKELESLTRGKFMYAAYAIAHWLSDYNTAMENAVRLSAYKAARDKGLSKEKSASIAKNLTVNFNRKGAKTTKIAAFYAFFNASLQGTVRMGQTLSGPAGKKIIAGGVALGAITTLLGMALMGDDEWEKIPEFVRERSLIIPIGGKKFLTIPLPLGFHILPNIGRKAVEMMRSDEKSKGRHVGDLLGILAEAFSPMGGGDIGQVITPTVADPIVALWRNKDWTGKPIYREDMNSMDPTPGFSRTKETASSFSKALTEAINHITGGTDYTPGMWSPTPDQFDYVIGQLTGGVGREAMKMEQSISAKVTGEELPPHKIPLVGRFYGTTEGQSGNSAKFYDNIKKLNAIEREVKGRARDGKDFDEVLDSKQGDLIGVGNAAERQVSKLRALRRHIIKEDLPSAKAETKEIDSQIGEVMQDLNKEMAAAGRK